MPSVLDRLKVLGWFEASSFILLLAVAMPLKYLYGQPIYVKYMGMAHGVLFMLYLGYLFYCAEKVKTPAWFMPLGTLAAILPFGPLLFDLLLNRQFTNYEAQTADNS